MDIEFHYYINYITALKAGFLPHIAQKIAYSAQYVDDNTEHYSVLQKENLSQYNNIITQSLTLGLTTREILAIYPVFHFIPGDEILKTSALRRDGSCRYMTTTPASRLAENCLKNAIKSHDPYWIGIASHAYADTWAHQNFTGLNDIYNCVDAHKSNGFDKDSACAHIGHGNLLHLPDSPGAIWYDYRLKDMKVNNSERFLEAMKWLFKNYIKYADDSLILNRPKNPGAVWKEFSGIISAIFTNDFTALEKIFGKDCGFSSSKFFMIKILGMNRSHRVELYQILVKKVEKELGITSSQFEIYNKNQWLNEAIEEISDSVEIINKHAANDNFIYEEKIATALCDSGQSYYGSKIQNTIQNKLASLLGIYKKLHIWKSEYYSESDWYKFQEGAKKQQNYMIDKVIRIMRKDLPMMRRENI